MDVIRIVLLDLFYAYKSKYICFIFIFIIHIALYLAFFHFKKSVLEMIQVDT